MQFATSLKLLFVVLIAILLLRFNLLSQSSPLIPFSVNIICQYQISTKFIFPTIHFVDKKNSEQEIDIFGFLFVCEIDRKQRILRIEIKTIAHCNSQA